MLMLTYASISSGRALVFVDEWADVRVTVVYVFTRSRLRSDRGL